MKDKALVEYKEGFFSKLKRKFKSIFVKNDKKESNNIDIIEENEVKTPPSEKERFFELYKKVLNNEIELSSVDQKDLNKIYKILNEEVRMKKEILAKKIKVLEEKKEIIDEIVKIANE